MALRGRQKRSKGKKQPLTEEAVEEFVEKPPDLKPSLLAPILYPLSSIVVLLLAWQVGTSLLDIPRYLLPAPTDIAGALVDDQGLLLGHSKATVAAIAVGFLAAMSIGIPLGTLLAFSRGAERLVYPLLVFSQSVPKVAIAPLFIVWFGFGLLPKVVVATLIAFFPIVISTTVGLKSTPREMVHLLRSMGSSRLQLFRKVQLPNALPSVFGGLKVAITLAVVGAVVGEFVGSDRGLGFLIQVARGNFDTTLLFAALIELSAIAVLLYVAIQALEGRLLRWRTSAE